MKQKNEKQEERKVILSLCIALLLLYLLTGRQYNVFIVVTILLGISGLFSALLTSVIVQAWKKFTVIWGGFISDIILSIVFFIIVTPIALLARLFRRETNIQLNKTKGESYYITRNHTYTSQDMEDLG